MIQPNPNRDPSRCTNLSYKAFYRLGCTQQNNPPATFSAAVKAPSPLISDPSQSGVKYVQAISVLRKRRYQGNTQCITRRASEGDFNTGWQLDSDPYGLESGQLDTALKRFSQGSTLTITAVDFPADELGDALLPERNVDAIYIHDYFEMYVYYFAGDPVNPRFQRWLKLETSNLPVARLAWKWGGQAVYDFIPSLQMPYSIQFSNQPPSSETGKEVAATRPFQGKGQAKDVAWAPCPGDTSTPTTNPIDWPRYFVERHYSDFLGKNPDAEGLNFWTANITPCAIDLSCIDIRRVQVSRAFWESADFQTRPEVQASGLLTGDPARPYDYRQFVRWCYINYLRRDPTDPNATQEDREGWNFWTNGLSGHGDYDQTIRAFLYSDHYRAQR